MKCWVFICLLGIATTSAKPYHHQLRSDENESNSKESGEQGEVDINKCLQPSVPGGSPPPGCPSQPPPKHKPSPPPECPPTPPPGEEGKYPPPPPGCPQPTPQQDRRQNGNSQSQKDKPSPPPECPPTPPPGEEGKYPPPGCPQPTPQQDRRQNGNGQSQKDKPSPTPQQQQQNRQREINGFLNALERILIDDE
ncbi:circumsporozoite protein-like [Ostrea edulis]|uniref:circumsporozoite protein-like n=1 Tax=Ostrea edulis TaxID=37623 RepID=UPI0024AFF065|nr:circumsporozoite protein-like [Ostrea edulis]